MLAREAIQEAIGEFIHEKIFIQYGALRDDQTQMLLSIVKEETKTSPMDRKIIALLDKYKDVFPEKLP
jgi:hypothetical protein